MIVLANTTMQLTESEISELVQSVQSTQTELGQPCRFFLEQLDPVCLSPSARQQIHLTVFVEETARQDAAKPWGSVLLRALQTGLSQRPDASCAVIIKHIPTAALGIDGIFLPDRIPAVD